MIALESIHDLQISGGVPLQNVLDMLIEAEIIHSLGTAIWQIISGRLPYGLANPVLPNCSEFVSIRQKLRGNILPGDIPRIVPGEVTTVIKQCWQQDPRLRPTAVTIAETLQDLIINLTCPIDNLTHASDTNFPAEKVMQASLELICEAREKNTRIPKIRRLPPADFNLLIDDNSWTPVKYFVVGAVIWWKLTDERAFSSLDDGLAPWLPLSADGEATLICASHFWKMLM
jgi:hypothetical protein